MGTDQRLQIFPTRMNLGIITNRLKSAQRGFSLLKRKSDALQKKHREIQAQLDQYKKDISEQANDAFFSLSEAEFHGANFFMYRHECKKFPINVTCNVDQISGVSLPRFTLNCTNAQIKSLDRSGPLLAKCRSRFTALLKVLVDVTSLQNSFAILTDVMKGVNRRVNALEFMLIPKLENTLNYINSELDEQDREEFFRLKKIQNMKKENV